MRNKKKTVKWLTYATGVILFLMLGLAFLAPKLINSSLVKEKLLHDLSRKTGGTITFQALELSLFPVPRLIIKQAGLAIPQKIEATIASLTIYPQVRPLLRGQVKISKVQAQDPAITITLSDRKESKPWSIEEISAAIQALVGDSARLTVTVEKGRLSFRKPGQVPASLQQVEARMVVDSHKDRLRVTLEPFKVASPQIRLSALLSIQPSSPRLSLEIRGRGLAVGPLRDLALFVAEEMPSVQNVCDILRDGQVPTLSFHSRGDSFEALGAPRNLEIKGDLEGGRIYVPGPGLDFTAVYGQYLISKGILQGTNLTGQYGNSDLKQTSLNLSLIEDDAPLHLEGLVRADLGEVLTLLPRFVKDKVFLDELSKVQSLSGTARGRLALGGKIGSLNAQVMASDLNFSARYERIPFPITIQGGEFTYDEKQVSLKNLTGTLGQSTFSGLAARMDQGQTPHLTVLSGKMRLQAAEIYGWLSSLELLRPALKEFTAVSGTIALS
ncbi:MAG: hypothetical protein L7F78_11285, partial [Syntrophales bacterium LBB04]|nr:hypothetical protein [Syntrophales bacterium LBB04]